MAIEEKTYLVCNYLTSRVVLSLRDTSVIIDGGSYDNPSKYPFTLNELQQINNTSDVFKTGELVPEDKEFVYDQLKINNWRSILSNEEIEDAILNPTTEKMQLIINISNTKYFERVYGIFIGLKNDNAPLQNNVCNIVSMRYKEIQNGIRESKIVLRKPEKSEVVDVTTNTQIDEMRQQLEAMKALIAAQKAVEPEKPKSEKAPAKKTVGRKPAAKIKKE